MGRMTIGLAIVAAMATMAASCGGGEDESAKEDFTSQADAICTKYDKKFENEVLLTYPSADPTSPSTPDEDVKKFADPLAATHDLYSDELDELRGLKPPLDFKLRYDSALVSLDRSLQALTEAADAAGNAERQRMTGAIERGQKASSDANEILRDYGFEFCG